MRDNQRRRRAEREGDREEARLFCRRSTPLGSDFVIFDLFGAEALQQHVREAFTFLVRQFESTSGFAYESLERSSEAPVQRTKSSHVHARCRAWYRAVLGQHIVAVSTASLPAETNLERGIPFGSVDDAPMRDGSFLAAFVGRCGSSRTGTDAIRRNSSPARPSNPCRRASVQVERSNGRAVHSQAASISRSLRST
jgi:hypothetical protein